jgi:hypothetical protein
VIVQLHPQEMSVQLAAEELIELEQHVRFLKGVKSAIHAGFELLHKNAINREFVQESLNLISLKMSQEKSLRRAFAPNY